jgi:hypothetical protein
MERRETIVGEAKAEVDRAAIRAAMADEVLYHRIGTAVAVLGGLAALAGVWVYCATSYGLLLGLGLGWVPGTIVGAVAALVLRFAWPLGAVALSLGLLLGWY